MKIITKLTTLLAAFAFGFPANGGELEEGAAAPDVTQKSDEGKDVNVKETAAEGYTLVYFYPKADTPGCTKQACSLRDSFEELTDKDVTVIGVSADTVDDQKAFKEKYELPFILLADKDATVIDAFGVPKNPRGFSSRQAFLFKDGKLVWRDLKASTDQQAADVLTVING
ncbi:MAG: peroxiredoxin [Verrucomicrobiota bacterium]